MRFSISGSSNLLSSCTVMLLSLNACTQSHPRSIEARPEPARGAESITEAESWTPQIAPGLYKYSIDDTATISINNDTTNQVLPIETTMSYSLTISPMEDSFSILGKVDSAKINSRLWRKAQIGDTTRNVDLHGVLTTKGNLRLHLEQQILSCSSSSNSMTSRIYELIVPYPKDKLKIGSKWSDTVSSTNCHGKTPLTQQTIRDYEVKKFSTWHDHSAMEVQRLVNITFTGMSTDPNSHLQATGSGSGDATLFLDQKTALILESASQTKSTVMIVTSRGQFPFTQLTSTHIMAQQ